MKAGEVVEHRPPLRRIEIGSATGADKRRDITEAMSGVGPPERDRIWRLLEQSAMGVNAPSAPAPAADVQFVDVVVTDDVADEVRRYLGGGGTGTHPPIMIEIGPAP